MAGADDDRGAVFVTSHDQSGGITAHTVNIGRQRLVFTRAIAEELLAKLPRNKRIETTVIGRKAVAAEIEHFLKENGYDVRRVHTVGIKAPPPEHQLELREGAQALSLVIAEDA